MSWITVASIQPPFYDHKSLENNRGIVEAGFTFLEEALKKSTAFCCLPEFFNVFGIEQDEMPAESSNYKDILERTEKLAKRYESIIILPLLVPDEGKYFNRAYVIDSKGNVVGYYNKAHLTLGEREKLSVAAGNEIKIFDTEYGKIAVAICYDVYFPEFFTSLTQLKPDIIFFPSLQRSDHEMASEAILKTRAMDTQAYIVRSSFGRETNLPWKSGMVFGQSCIVHPDGTILANAGHYEGFAIAYIQVPFDWQRQRCEGYPSRSVRKFLNEDRKPDLYLK